MRKFVSFMRRNPTLAAIAALATIAVALEVLLYVPPHAPPTVTHVDDSPLPAAVVCQDLRVTNISTKQLPRTYRFELSLRVDGGLQARNVYWIFGQSQPNPGNVDGPEMFQVTHTYSDPGTYSPYVALDVVDAQGQLLGSRLRQLSCQQTVTVL